MPGKKNDSKTSADSSESADVSAPREPSAGNAPPVDLMNGLAVGTPMLGPLDVTFRGIDFAIRRWYPPEDIWKLSDLQRVVFPASPPPDADPDDMAKFEEHISILLVDNLTLQLKVIVVPDDHKVIVDLLTAWDTRTRGELNRILQYLYQLAGITNAQGEFLAF